MIHQFIFASPRPGMTEAEFQKYWLEIHAVRYASKIKQIKKYLIDTRIDFSGDRGADPMFGGIAEIWLNNDKEQLESLQSPEFLEGARLDEPKWAAFWKTLVLDTDAHVLLEGPPPVREPTGVKTVILLRRKEGLTVEAFRKYALEKHAKLNLAVPGLRRLVYGTTRDGWYGFGEPRFDMVSQFWFDDLPALEKAMTSPEMAACREDDKNFVEMRYLFVMAVKEHWVIGPQPRD